MGAREMAQLVGLLLVLLQEELTTTAASDLGIQHPLWLLWAAAHMHTRIHTSIRTCTNFNNLNVEDIEDYN